MLEAASTDMFGRIDRHKVWMNGTHAATAVAFGKTWLVIWHRTQDHLPLQPGDQPLLPMMVLRY